MAKLGLIHGAFLLENKGRFFQVGDVKGPGDYGKEGFKKPEDFDPMTDYYIELQALENAKVKEPYMTFVDEEDSKSLCDKLHERLVIKRNASTSTRAWYLVFDAEENDGKKVVNIQWLLDMPMEVWEIVQDEIWSC